MANEVPTHTEEIPERLRPVQQALERAVRKAFLTGQAYDPDGKGYAYWNAQGQTEQAVLHTAPRAVEEN